MWPRSIEHARGCDRRRFLQQAGGGPGVRPPLPPEFTVTLLKDQWNPSSDAEDHRRRRSIYLFVRRNLRYPLFDVFDRPDTNATCPMRHESTTATQSLVLLNSAQSLDGARHLAGAVLGAAPHDIHGKSPVLTGASSRAPDAAERSAASDFLQRQAAGLKAAGREPTSLALPEPLPATADPHAAAALVDFCLALFNSSEAVYID